MLDVMCPIILEGESVAQELLDTVLINIIEPQKVNLQCAKSKKNVCKFLSH